MRLSARSLVTTAFEGASGTRRLQVLGALVNTQLQNTWATPQSCFQNECRYFRSIKVLYHFPSWTVSPRSYRCVDLSPILQTASSTTPVPINDLNFQSVYVISHYIISYSTP